MGAFADQVSAWARKTPERMEAVYRRSVKLLTDEMTNSVNEGGRVPYQEGNLVRSIEASTEAMPKTADRQFAGSTVGVVIATLKLDQTIWIGYQAIYARRVNYGYVGADKLGRVFNQQGSYFVEGAIAQWSQIVAQAAKEIQGNRGGL